MFNALLRSLRGPNLEIFKFGMYLAFPIGWMYYFGTNLDERFSVPDFWPTQEQSHKLPREREELAREVERIRLEMKERVQQKQKMQLEEAKIKLRQGVQSND
ncbi:hypothetical protein DV736_g3250, partial [Chaetothyriales sp. CBS 134916]